jgi:quinol monooxygenase YgiN
MLEIRYTACIGSAFGKKRGLIVMTLRVRIELERREEIRELSSLYFGPVSFRLGCNNVDLYLHGMQPEEFLLVEEWRSWKYLQNHIISVDFQNILDIIDLAKEPPEIRFHTVSSTKGFTMVEELRKNITLGYYS